MKGKQVALAHAQQLFAQERETVLVSLPPAKSEPLMELFHATKIVDFACSPFTSRSVSTWNGQFSAPMFVECKKNKF